MTSKIKSEVVMHVAFIVLVGVIGLATGYFVGHDIARPVDRPVFHSAPPGPGHYKTYPER